MPPKHDINHGDIQNREHWSFCGCTGGSFREPGHANRGEGKDNARAQYPVTTPTHRCSVYPPATTRMNSILSPARKARPGHSR